MEIERLKLLTPAESLQMSFQLTEQARNQLADEIAQMQPAWSREQVLAERNRRWLRRALEGELWDDSTKVLYDVLQASETGDPAPLEHAASIVRANPEPFGERFNRLAQQLGVTEEWQSILDRLEELP